jgi:hypothetical protein
VEIIESHITFIKDILDIVGLSGGLVYRKDDGNKRDSFNRRNSMGRREDIIKSYARTLSTVLHQCSAKLAKIEASLSSPDITPVETKKLEKLIISLKLYFETGLPPINLMIPISQKRRKSLNAPIDRNIKIHNMRRKGMLLMDKSKIFSSVKPRWIILDDKKLHIFKDEQATTAYKELPLENILNISSAKLGKHEFGFNISCLDGTVLHFAAPDKAQMASWMLSIDGIKHNFSFNTCMEQAEKTALLRHFSYEQWKGGYVKSNHQQGEGDWAYLKDGTLCVTEGEEKHGISFKWNGEIMQANRKSTSGPELTANTGLTARWNGITLAYYFLPNTPVHKNSKQTIFIPKPVVTYSWYEHDREYRPIEGINIPSYKWTRHFFLEKAAPAGSGEWIVEGDIPEPIVMILQLYHYHKNHTSFPVIEDVNKLPPALQRQKSTTINLPMPLPNSEAMEMFLKHAPPGSPKMEFPNFVTLMQEVKPGLSESEVKLAFELVDVNKDGCIDSQEFSTWFPELKEWGSD